MRRLRISRNTRNDAALGHARLSLVLPSRSFAQQPAQKLIEDPGNQKFLSVASCWEIAIKAGLGKLRLGEPSKTYISTALARTGIELLPISLYHAAAVENLPAHHRDPFDRLLISQAMAESLEIVSIDKQFDAYPVIRHW